jgi:LPS-assembly lipoprotein
MWWCSPVNAGTRRRPIRSAALAGSLLLAAVTGCGFQPLYGTKTTRDRAVIELSSVAIDPIPDRIGQLVRNDLIDRIHTKGRDYQPRYRLKVDLTTANEGLAVRSDDVVTRRNMTLSATYSIYNSKTGAVLFEGHTFSVASYNVGNSEFANLSAQRDARVRTAREVSEEIKNQVVYFVRTNGMK